MNVLPGTPPNPSSDTVNGVRKRKDCDTMKIVEVEVEIERHRWCAEDFKSNHLQR